MPKPYEQDLRRKVLEAIERNGMKRREASELFGGTRRTHELLAALSGISTKTLTQDLRKLES
jgi:transposase